MSSFCIYQDIKYYKWRHSWSQALEALLCTYLSWSSFSFHLILPQTGVVCVPPLLSQPCKCSCISPVASTGYGANHHPHPLATSQHAQPSTLATETGWVQGEIAVSLKHIVKVTQNKNVNSNQ